MATKKAAPKKVPALLLLEENGDKYTFKVQGKGKDLVTMLKECMEQDKTLSNIVKVALLIS